MYEAPDKDIINSEILPHLSVAKHGCLDENVPPALRIHERWEMVANTTLSILLYKINFSYVLLTATACFLFSFLSFFFYRLSNLSYYPINTFVACLSYLTMVGDCVQE